MIEYNTNSAYISFLREGIMYSFLFLFASLVVCNGETIAQPHAKCPQSNMYIPIEGKNIYIECKDYQPITKTCPEGYFFNSNAQWPENPCLDAPQRIPYKEADVTTKGSICTQRNSYVNDGYCDSYIECRDFKPIKRTCPDGLNFNDAKWPYYPCSYPYEAPCRGREQSQAPKPTAACKRQYGIFPSPNAAVNECGRYIICTAGNAFDMYCPFGLAFNPATSSCDWPYNVPSCNVDEFYGIKCPPGQIDESGNSVVTNLKYGNECHYFFSCQDGKGRLLSCDPGFAFNAESGRCEDADYVDCNIKRVPKSYPARYAK